MIGKTISHYKISEKLGAGGMGVVYKAKDNKLDRTVALKFLPPHLHLDDEAEKRFISEAKAASSFDHPNICTIYEIDKTDEDQLFIAMACYEGETLKKKLDQGPLKIDEVIKIASQVAEGLSKAHKKGIVHRDIKPANIFITNDGTVKILDFGLAKVSTQTKITTMGTTSGTIAYMSPEQTKGEDVDQRTDIWSLGVVMYEMLTGELPFKGDYEQAVVYSILNEEPPAPKLSKPDVPAKLKSMVSKCLEKDRNERYTQSEELLGDIISTKDNKDSKTKWKKSNTGFPNRRKFALGAAILAALIIIVYWSLFPSDQQNQPSSIAVLPFKNLNADPSLEYFSDGMTETIISDLANIRGLAVISRTSVMSYKNSDKKTNEIGLDLNVTHILEGSILTSGDEVRIFAQLIDVETDAHLWAKTYDRKIKDIFSIQSDVANNIAEVMEVALGEDAQARIDEQPTTNLEAYHLYLKGQYYLYGASFAYIDSAISMFKQATILDPNFALAYAVLAKSYILNNVEQDPSSSWEEKAYVSFQQALSLDPDLAEAYVARGMWYWTPQNKFQHENAIRDFEKAINLKPGLSSAYEQLSLVELHVGLLDRAMETGKESIEFEPTNMWARHFVGQVFFFQGRYEEALKMFETIRENFRTYIRITFTAQTLYYLGRIDEAASMIEDGLTEFPDEPQLNSSYAIILAKLGRKDDAMQRMELAIKNKIALRHVHHLYHNLARASALLGLKEDAVEWLKMAAETGLPCYPLFKRDIDLQSLKGYPDFEKFMLEMKNKLDYYKTL